MVCKGMHCTVPSTVLPSWINDWKVVNPGDKKGEGKGL